jgi:tetratricopeptide (TPR) repeat protein
MRLTHLLGAAVLAATLTFNVAHSADDAAAAKAKVQETIEHLETGKFRKAVATASAALKLDPRSFQAAAMRAGAQIALGNTDAARPDIELAEQLNPQWDSTEMKKMLENVARAKHAMSAAGLKQIEADRNLAFASVRRHLQATCGSFSVPKFSPGHDSDQLNEDMQRYGNCVKQWARNALDVHDSHPANVLEAIDRLLDIDIAVEFARQEFHCSKAPKDAVCWKETEFARTEAALAGIADPVEFLAKAEFRRLNAEVAAYNKSVDRHDTKAEIADFLNELGRALQED